MASRIHRRMELRRSRRYVPRQQFSNDFYLVEFPKSGVTWLSVIFANLLLINNRDANRATFSSVRSYIPDIHVCREALASEFSSPRVRVYKSHAAFNAHYVNVIYLVRHPAAVLWSHYRYSTAHSQYDGTYSDFCFKSESFGVEAWKRHISLWCNGVHDSDRHFMHLLKYEDLLQDPCAEVANIANNFGWSFEDSVIQEAIDYSSRESMRAQEALYRANNPMHKIQFVSAGENEQQDEAIKREIARRCESELQLLGYTDQD